MATSKPFVFLFTGDEFLRRGKIESLLDQLLTPSLRLTNLSRCYPDDLDWPYLLSQAATPSLLGGSQAFWISQADEIKKADWSYFESYCSKPAKESYFIFEADELTPAHPLVKLVGRFGQRVHSARPSGESGFEALWAKLKRLGKTLTPGAWQVLEERLGSSGRLMDMALDQLVLYSESSTIDETAVRDLTKEFLHYEPFDLTEALARKDIVQALKIFHFFYEMSGDMASMIGLIHWQLKRIWQAKKILARGGDSDEISRTLRVPPFRLNSFLSQVKRFDLRMVEKLLETLWQIDWNTKRGVLDEAIAMETFLASVN